MSSSSWTMGRATRPRRSRSASASGSIRHGERRSLNAARNTGLRESGAPLVAFVDDDVLVPPGWLDALVEGAERHPDAEAFGGPIRARFEGHAAARLRPRGSADHHARPRARGRGGRDGLGRELRGAPLRGGADRRVRREPRPRARRRGGMAAAPARGRRPDRLPRRGGARPPAQRRRLRACASSRARPTTAAAGRARATAAADRRRGSHASCACWPAAAGTRSGARARRA